MLCEACGSDLHVAGTSLLSESMCRLCSRQQTEKQRGTRALHVVNELVTPDVEYESWKEFAGLVYAVQDSYCECVAQATMLAVAQQQFSLVLGRVYGFSPELTHLQERGPGIILRLTKSQGVFWCKMVAHLLYTRVARAAAIFNDVAATLAAGDDEGLLGARTIEPLIDVMQQEVRHTFAGAMPFSIYTLCSGFVSTLLVKNFTLYDDGDFTAFTHAQFCALLLALCMGLHPRLGQHCPLLALQDDVLRCICAQLAASQRTKHIVFHTQEQWLVA